LPDSRQRMHPYASPLISVRQAGLPPALILTAGCDVLYNEAEKYAAALIGAGVPTQVVRFAGITHSALVHHRPALDEIAYFLRHRLGEFDSVQSIQPIKPNKHAFQSRRSLSCPNVKNTS